jgi:formylglycine-generating enzyme required for sulfatase activity
MRFRLQHSLAVGAVLLAALAAWLASAPADAPAEEKKVVKHEKYTEKIPDTDVSFDMVPIPGGTFVMGSPKDEKGRADDEGPQHPVEIKPFWMGKCEVTWDEYDIYRKEKGLAVNDDFDKIRKKDPDAITGPTKPYVDAYYGHGKQGYPALCMTHHAAMEYCRWLSSRTGKAYRLPTEAEWEYAARAGTKTAYFFGDDEKKLRDYAWYDDNAEDHTHPVGKKKPNPWGLYDMYGNVMEWCLDHYQKDFYAKFSLDKPTLCPVNMPTEYRFAHVARGGSWLEKANECRSASRKASDPSWIKDDPQKPQSIWWLTQSDFVGFRVVRAVEEYPQLKGIKSKVTRQSKDFP